MKRIFFVVTALALVGLDARPQALVLFQLARIPLWCLVKLAHFLADGSHYWPKRWRRQAPNVRAWERQ